MFDSIKNVNEKNAELFWAAVQRPAYMSMALDALALGQNDASDADAAERVLDEIREDLISSERAKSRELLKRERQKQEQQKSLTDIVIQSLERDKGDLADRNSTYARHFGELKVAILDTHARRACRAALLHVGIAYTGLILLICFTTLAGYEFFGVKPIVAASVTLVFSLVSAIWSFDTLLSWIKGRVEGSRRRALETALRETLPPEFATLDPSFAMLPDSLRAIAKGALLPKRVKGAG